MTTRITAISGDVNLLNFGVWELMVSKFDELSNIKITRKIDSSEGAKIKEHISIDESQLNILGHVYNVYINNGSIHVFSESECINDSVIKYIIDKFESVGIFHRFAIEVNFPTEDFNTLNLVNQYVGDITKSDVISISTHKFNLISGYRFENGNIKKFKEVNTLANINAKNMMSQNIEDIIVILNEENDGN